MSSLRLALKMSREEAKTPDINEIKAVTTKQNKLSSIERTTAGSNKQIQSAKRKKSETQNDEKSRKIKNDEENLSEAETEDSLKLTSDQDDSNLGIPFKKAKTTNDKKKKATPPDQHSAEKSSEHYDAVESLIASRQTPPIGTSATTSSANTPSKKSSKERPKTPVMPNSSKHENSILPIESPQPQVKEETEVTEASLPIPQADVNTSKMTLVTPEAVKMVPMTVPEAPKSDDVVEPKVDIQSASVNDLPKESSPEDTVEVHTDSIQESTLVLDPQPDDNKDAAVALDVEDLVEKTVSAKKNASNKKKRKGGPDMPETEEMSGSTTVIEPGKVEEPDGEKGGETVRAPSRAAAMAAKSKINSTKVKIAPEVEQKKVEENSVQVAPVLPDIPPQPALLKAQWVACDKCSKWRRIPGDIDLSTLPEEWYCTMNM
jgi:hypothetical protein